ncbi:MAG: aminotransferase class III-fold pyridoxal phosphate-dependent enzyme, partial [Candidatus Aminicenantes bacterium]|nr:aminotransferase class III-fold pyridoxal phosphate-dependent enzyme [Candidatus Aminicenantes bacterium]
MLGRPLHEMPFYVFDLSVGSPLFVRPGLTDDPEVFGRILKRQMDEEKAQIGIGRYNEARLMYTSSIFSTGESELDESRTIHLGIDVFSKAGTPVFAPLDGFVHVIADNARPLDYGPTLILRHETSGEGTFFFTLYGHLKRGSLENLSSGTPVKRGDKVAEIGDSLENGGWPPHLHFQVMTDMLLFTQDFPGVAPATERDIWLSFCPDPNLILQVPADRLKPVELEREDVLERRKSRLGPSLSLSYRSPLKIVRGFGQYLYTETGRRYLDGVNNVPHVGHSHPKVSAAVQKQQAVLNTNTRYLHDRIIEYAERLTQMLPESLSVCFFVNSGSEANDLALRLARSATGGTDTIVLDGAYHGNLSSLIAVSPYKFNGPGGTGKPDGTHVVPMPDPYRGIHPGYGAESGQRYAKYVRAAVEKIGTTGKKLKAFIAEPLMGCGGQIIFPDSFLEEAYKWVRKAGGVNIADEVQIGFGRVGTRFWGFETQNVVPDIVTMGKPIG